MGYINPPNIIDANGNVDYENVKYDLVIEDGKTIIEIEVDKDYLEREDLKYPIIIDPTMLWMSNYLSTAGVWSASFMADSSTISNQLTVSNSLLNAYPYQDTENRMYVDTSNLSTTNAFVGSGNSIQNKYIESATISFSETEKPAHYPTGTVQIKRVLGEWDPATITWNTQPQISEDYIGEAVCTGLEGERHNVDITNWVQGIADGELENNGLVFTCPKPGMAACIYGPEMKYILDENGRPIQSLYMCIAVTYRDMSSYDATVNLTAEYNEETGKIETTIEDTNTLAEGVTITGYKIFERADYNDNFSAIYTGTDISEIAEISVDGVSECIDLRACILYSDGTVKPSNIVTLQRYEETEEETTEENAAVSSRSAIVEIPGDDSPEVNLYFEQAIIDTDGDGLEDGYEIWDFKTKWNEIAEKVTEEESAEENSDDNTEIEYITDSDDDGLPDGYEVFTIGTNPSEPSTKDENGDEIDTDGDGLSDIEEYKNGLESAEEGKVETNPLLWDSDFDNTSDQADATPTQTNSHTRQTVAADTEVKPGLYDRQYSETEDGVTFSYITNIYSGAVKQMIVDYGDISLNKTMKYFYDSKGNNTAIIEQYDEKYDPKHTQTICITYTYDESNNVTFICDQWTKYTMEYKNGEMTSLKVGNQELIKYNNTKLVDNKGEDGDTSKISVGDIVDSYEDITTYGNGQTMKTITTTYKVEDDDTTSKAIVAEVYYSEVDDEGETTEKLSYVTEYNSEGKILKLSDYTQNSENPVDYNYTYTANTTSVKRSDDFTKSVTTEESEDGNTSTTTTSYEFKDVKGDTQTYSSAVAANTEENSSFTMTKLYNNDTYEYSVDSKSEKEIIKEDLYSSLYDKYILETTHTINSNISSTYDINIYAEDKKIDYTYDLTGNITEVKINDTVRYQYSYDAHGRLTSETDYVDKKYYMYEYNETGNMQGKTVYSLDENGNKITSTKKIVQSEYNNEQWPDQMTSYNNKDITYDNAGNPVEYINGEKFTWSRGRQLSKVDLSDDERVIYKYNEDGLRVYKETSHREVVDSVANSTEITYKYVTDMTITYEWDENKLIRESVNYNTSGRTYDIWYFYDSTGSVIGYEYSYINDQNEKSSIRIYYEKDFQGNIIGLLDSRGAEIATYSYDAWGNITATVCYEGYETAYNLNHLTYRGYYRDEETGFYYLQSRYYDAEICRFINADDVDVIGVSNSVMFKDNLYVYCNGNPINYFDPDGYLAVPISAITAAIDLLIMSLPAVNNLYKSLKTIAKLYKYDGALLRSKIATLLSYLVKPLAKLGIGIGKLTANKVYTVITTIIGFSISGFVVQMLIKCLHLKKKTYNYKIFGRKYYYDCIVF